MENANNNDHNQSLKKSKAEDDDTHMDQSEAETSEQINTIVLKNLSYQYKTNSLNTKPFELSNISLNITQGSRVLLVGTNGAGKSTLLSILGGTKLIPEWQASILGKPAFHDYTLKQNVAFLGDPWKRDYCYGLTLRDLLNENANSPRVISMAKFLDIDLDWPLAYISDGQRRRSQLLFSFIQPKEIYLLDEVTTDLDLLARDGLFRLLRNESESLNATIVYATHIFDDMEGWPTHIMYLCNGHLKKFAQLDSLPEYLAWKNKKYNPLYSMIRDWFISEKDI